MRGEDFKNNIWKYYIFMFLRQFMLILPIMVLFYQENGLTMNQIGFLATIAGAITLILEVPSGAFADLYGRKKSMIIGSLIITAGYFVRAVSMNFINFCIAMSLISLGAAFVSGADKALLYDSLKELKKEKLFKKIAGTANFLSLLAMGLGSFFGGLIAAYGLRTVHYSIVIPFFLAFLISFTFKEPKRYKKIIKSNYFKHLKEGLIFTFTHKKVRLLILLSSLTVGFMLVSHIFFQPYMKQIGIVPTSFGVFYLMFLGISAISSKGAYIIEEKIGKSKSIIAIPLILALQLFLMSNFSFYYSFLFLFLGQFIWGFTSPIVGHYINDNVKSHHRATILSINAMGYQIIWAIFAPLIGWFVDIWTLQTALLIQAAIVVAFSAIIFGFWKIDRVKI